MSDPRGAPGGGWGQAGGAGVPGGGGSQARASHGRKGWQACSPRSLAGASPGAWQVCAGPVSVAFILLQYQCPECLPFILDALFSAMRAAGTHVSQAVCCLRVSVQFSPVSQSCPTL